MLQRSGSSVGTRNNVEEGLSTMSCVSGYADLATFIASDADKSTVIFRRFDRLSARSLLYMQSELEELQGLQDLYDQEDLKGTTAQQEIIRNWTTLKKRAEKDGDQNAQKRLLLVAQIRDKMKEYREALVFESTLLSLKAPAPRVLKAYQNVFNNVGISGEPFPALGGASADTYSNDDLMALHILGDEDRMTALLRYYFPTFFVVRRTDSPLTYVSESRLHLAVAIINLVAAAMLLFGAIYSLYYVTCDQVKLGLITGFTIAFAICIGLLTNARRSEVFGACAAYAAVLVVFISGDFGPAPSGKYS